MRTSGKITAKTYYRRQTSDAAYRSMITKIIALDAEIFSHPAENSAAMEKLFNDPGDKDNIAILFEDGSKPVGYFFLKNNHGAD